MKKNKKALMVMAHPDDEVIFGWPIFFDENIEKTLLICSTDRKNPERQWCAHRVNVLANICQEENVLLYGIDNNSSFYRTATRRPPGVPQTIEGDASAPYRSMNQLIINTVLEMEDDYDFIFTHNPYGEYGHVDHILLFDLMLKNVNIPIVFTDIIQLSNWAGYETEKCKESISWKIYYNNKISEHVINEEKYEKYKKIYEKYNCWTWDRETVKKCNLYEIKKV